MKHVLITGVSGFAGSYLTEYLLSLEVGTITGTYHTSPRFVEKYKDTITLVQVDLTDKKAVEDLIRATKPDVIYHLAALTSPVESFKDPMFTFTNNIASEFNILEAVRIAELIPRILVISSAEVYGMVASEDLPVDESTQLRPATPYAVSKIAQDFLALQYFLAHKLEIIRARPFNHIGPRQEPKFVIPAFCQQIAEIEKGKKTPSMKVGNLDAKRDFTDVRDVVRAYHLLIEKGHAGGVYNIGSGQSYMINNILNKLLQYATVKISVEVDPQLLRPVDTPDIRSDMRKIQKDTGWKPEIPLEQTLKETLDYWRNIV